MKKGLPCLFTSLGLVAGCISIVLSVSYGNLTMACYFILIAAFFDFIDGFTARMVDGVSEFGKQLDSLADVVSFGVAPSMILYRLILLSFVISTPDARFDVVNPYAGQQAVMFSTFIIAVFAALRLAKFNLDPGQSKSFRGLPVPANALFIAGLGFAAESSRSFPGPDILFSKWFLLGVVVVFSFLMVSNIRMFSLKMASYKIKDNLVPYIFLLFSLIFLIIFQLPGLSLVILLYILMSVVTSLRKA
jgi:CDP-diacylglycerol--serine O-phosphatidyltransferase